MFELRRDPVTGWWSAIVADRAYSRDAFTIEAQPVEGTHCRHCDEADADEPPHHVRRVALRSDAFHRIDSTKQRAAQLSLSEVERATGSWEILVGPRNQHARMADAAPQLAGALVRTARDAMRTLADEPRETDADGKPEPLYIQVIQNHGRHLREEGLVDLVRGVGRLVIVRMIFDAEIHERDACRMKRSVIGLHRPVINAARELLRLVVTKQDRDRRFRDDRLSRGRPDVIDKAADFLTTG